MEFNFDNLSLNLSYISEMNRNIQEIKVEAQVYNDEDELETIAEVKIKRVLYLKNQSHDDNFFDFDCISEQMCRLFESCLIEDEDGMGGSKFINDEHNEYDGLIYIEELRVTKDCRRSGVGKALIQEIVKMIGAYDDIMLVLPFPIEANGNDKAHKKVISFWEKLGFEQVDDTDFWSMDCIKLKERRDFIEEVEFNKKKQYNFKEIEDIEAIHIDTTPLNNLINE